MMAYKAGQIRKGERLSPQTEFKKGITPWCKGMKGIHLSPNTEFKKGFLNGVEIGIRKCNAKGCEEQINPGDRYVMGFCNKHYQQFKKTGDPNTPLKKLIGKPAIDRFFYMINKTDTCWNWKGHLDKRGYGRFTDENGWYDMAHRWSYKHFVGEIPDGLVVHHKCKNPKCVNPKHLVPATYHENTIEFGVSNASFVNSKKTHCKHGHPLTEDNIYRSKGKYGVMRVCKICHKDRVKQYLERKKKAA